jgi:hypothetical protein
VLRALPLDDAILHHVSYVTLANQSEERAGSDRWPCCLYKRSICNAKHPLIILIWICSDVDDSINDTVNITGHISGQVCLNQPCILDSILCLPQHTRFDIHLSSCSTYERYTINQPCHQDWTSRTTFSQAFQPSCWVTIGIDSNLGSTKFETNEQRYYSNSDTIRTAIRYELHIDVFIIIIDFPNPPTLSGSGYS